MEKPKGGLIGSAEALARWLRELSIPAHAADAGYFMVLSVFPMLVLLLSVLRYTDLDTGDLMQLLAGFLPGALLDEAETLIIRTYAHTGAAMVGVSALSALWSAGRGFHGILRGFNAVYGVEESRGYFYTRCVSAGYTFAFLTVLVLSLALNVFGEFLLEAFFHPRSFIWALLSGILNLRFVLMLLLQTAVFAAMYTVLPNRKNRFRRQIPGAVLASIGWLVFSDLFSWYVENWAGYSNVYGSVYAVALAMLWLYCCLNILFYGAALNRFLEREEPIY